MTYAAALPLDERAGEALPLPLQPGIASAGAAGWHPEFEVTPADFIDVIVTGQGLIERPDAAGVTCRLRRS